RPAARPAPTSPRGRPFAAATERLHDPNRGVAGVLMRSRWLLALSYSFLSMLASPALARPSGPGTEDVQAAARAHGEEGLRRFEAKRWADAYDEFKQADDLFHAPTLVMFMAHCRRNEGRLLEARALYEKVASEPIPKGAPEQWGKAVAAAHDEIVAIQKRIPSVQATITGPGADQARAAIDGAP